MTVFRRSVIGMAVLFSLLAHAATAAEYHVSSTGSDDADGTAENPFRTLFKATAALHPGDVCIVHEGVYRETMVVPRAGQPDKPIRVQAAPGARVVISATEPLKTQWTRRENGVYAARIDSPPAQLFFDGQMAREAHWPNGADGDLMDRPCVKAEEGTGYERIVCKKLPPGDFNGGYALIWRGGAWTNATVRIKDYRPGESLAFDPPFQPHSDQYHQGDAFKPRAGNRFLLLGSPAALDVPGEWLVEPGTGLTLFLPPPGKAPEDLRLETKARDHVLILRGCSHVAVDNIELFGGAFDLSGANHCLLENVRSFYSNHFARTAQQVPPYPANRISGNHNRLRRCHIAYSAGAGLDIQGEGNSISNCVIHDIGYMGTYEGAVQVKGTKGTVIDHSSIYRCGRDLILHHQAQDLRITYCDLHHAVMLNDDAGATYAWGTDGRESVIAYNWVHHSVQDHTVGIYLDNFCKNFLVHHNVVWACGSSGITLNCDAHSHLVANNTIAQCPKAFGTFAYHRYTPDQSGTRIVNNLLLAPFDPADPHHVISGAKGAVLESNGTGAVDADGLPLPDSAAVDAGVVLPGVTDGFRGAAPDLGAYERGAPLWRPGADWDKNPTPRPDIAFAPQAAITEETMLRDGLLLWLDASAENTLEQTGGVLTRWHDRRTNGRAAAAGAGFTVAAGMGRTVVHSAGQSGLKVGRLRAEKGSATVLLVARSESDAARPWQRLLVSSSGDGPDWISPSFIIMRPNGEKPTPFAPRIFLAEYAKDVVLDNVHLASSAHGDSQSFIGELAEVLVFDRLLRFDELLAIQNYLRAKWSIEKRGE
ncbi:MAG: right-handed parallel beta-helix repeat-containing protein [Rhodopirellula sp.]|nr:right-handed parallel beta-helix repeat-containing protein [Rhodopirellula sp.]